MCALSDLALVADGFFCDYVHFPVAPIRAAWQCQLNETQTGVTDMTIQEIIEQAIKNAKPVSRKQRAIWNYQAIKGEYAPDDICESWADRA